jgi:sister-chromatid-cohesion protein PDS5
VRVFCLFCLQTLKGGPTLTELDLDPSTAGERGLRLLLVLAFVFPSHFLYQVSLDLAKKTTALDICVIVRLISFQDILKELLVLISEDINNVASFVLQILTFIGKKQPLG